MQPLDKICSNYELNDVVFMKVDVEGAELEVLGSAVNILSSSLVAIRSEVNFIPTRLTQPLYCDIENFLRQYNFFPMDFLFLDRW